MADEQNERSLEDTFKWSDIPLIIWELLIMAGHLVLGLVITAVIALVLLLPFAAGPVVGILWLIFLAVAFK